MSKTMKTVAIAGAMTAALTAYSSPAAAQDAIAFFLGCRLRIRCGVCGHCRSNCTYNGDGFQSCGHLFLPWMV